MGVILLLMLMQTDWVTVLRPLEKQVPRIEIQVGEAMGVCSGVVINAQAGFVLSAAHCFEGKAEDLNIAINGRHAEMVKMNKLLDLAVLKFKVRGELEMGLADKSPEAGTEICVAGFMLAQKQFHAQFGRIAARRSDDGALVLDSVILPGDSGGAIVNIAGQLVGMSNQYYKGTAVGLAIPVEKVEDFVEQYLPQNYKKP
jgi:S1-C subfamily serine protease